MDTIAPSALLIGLVYAVTMFLRSLRGRDWNAVTTQLAVWGGGAVAVFLFAQTDFADALIPGTAITFADANGWSLLFIGVTIGSSATVVRQAFTAIDNTTSVSAPPLVPPTSERNAG